MLRYSVIYIHGNIVSKRHHCSPKWLIGKSENYLKLLRSSMGTEGSQSIIAHNDNWKTQIFHKIYLFYYNTSHAQGLNTIKVDYFNNALLSKINRNEIWNCDGLLLCIEVFNCKLSSLNFVTWQFVSRANTVQRFSRRFGQQWSSFIQLNNCNIPIDSIHRL